MVSRLWYTLLLLLSAVFVSCDVAQPALDSESASALAAPSSSSRAPALEEALGHDLVSGEWFLTSFTMLAAADELLHDGVLYRVTDAGLERRGALEPYDLFDADATYDEEELVWTPQPDEWVLVLGVHDDAGHRRLRDVVAGDRFAFQGRVFDTRASKSANLDIRASGEVLAEVTDTSVRRVHDLIDVEVEHADGSRQVISATPEHPFYVPSFGGYMDVADIREGERLQLSGGGEATLVGKTWRQGEFDVYNFVVEGEHNYFVGEEKAAGRVLVHNAACVDLKKPPKPAKPSGTYAIKFPNNCWYIGKGLFLRALRSARNNAGRGGGEALEIWWKGASSPEAAYLLEAQWMSDMAWDPNRRGKLTSDGKGCHAGRLLNKINSPGLKL